MRIFDITPIVSPRLAVWPGDTPPSREVLLDMARGDNITLSTLHSTVHLGAHADAPSHYGRDGATIDHQSVERYLGPCEVVHLKVERGVRFGPDVMPHPPRAERVLLGTGTFPDPTAFNPDFAAPSPELIEWLHQHKVTLIGTDTPSVDLSESKDLPSHHACLKYDMAILEGLVLRDLPAGVYELIALPLKLEGFDASPVRAVLRSS